MPCCWVTQLVWVPVLAREAVVVLAWTVRSAGDLLRLLPARGVFTFALGAGQDSPTGLQHCSRTWN